jgi:hypothetical protein
MAEVLWTTVIAFILHQTMIRHRQALTVNTCYVLELGLDVGIHVQVQGTRRWSVYFLCVGCGSGPCVITALYSQLWVRWCLVLDFLLTEGRA